IPGHRGLMEKVISIVSRVLAVPLELLGIIWIRLLNLLGLNPRNTMVDFWYTGMTGPIAVATLKASFELATATRFGGIPGLNVEKDHIFAYSNLRTWWKPHYEGLPTEQVVEWITGVRLDPNIPSVFKRFE